MTTRPVGVFDSGIGGLSVLQALRADLPHQSFVYVADSGHSPYGERDPSHVIARARALTRYLREAHDIQTLVVACNTATAAAIHLLREENADLPIVGLEPALKPAALASQTHRVGVLATRGTLQSAKFQALHQSLTEQADFVLRACDGLADAIEHQDLPRIEALAREHVTALGSCGAAKDQIDTVVLGCTHYPLILPTLQALLGPEVTLVESGAPVARQTRRMLPQAAETGEPRVLWYTTGDAGELQTAVQRWLQPQARVETLRI
ncbi:MAG: glutamate racemase [Hylemonella sp.]|uniref:glutamate racemase n=1 Tax=Hylemonella sp. TaxID=2066020 RepID=UPI0022CCBB26|nr:glutamate racemase [Hylemonella sp.]MCZ8251479.1 glutamate racemase [Hylemonella sp.]